MNRDARRAFLTFATSPGAHWLGNFRDFSGAIRRMATLAQGGRIDRALVEDEIERLKLSWNRGAPTDDPRRVLSSVLNDDALADMDRFDLVQLADVVDVCRTSKSLSAAGRTLFAASRTKRTSTNDADRLRKYLQRFGLRFGDL